MHGRHGQSRAYLELCCPPQSDDKELREFTPSFLWLLRDFYLKLEDEYGRKVGPGLRGQSESMDAKQ